MYTFLGVIALLAGLALLVYQNRDRFRNSISKLFDEQKSRGIRGLVIGPLTMVLIRFIGIPIVSFVVVSIVFWLVILFSSLTGPTMLQVQISLALSAVFAFALMLPDEKLSVPLNTVAPLTFFGTLYRVYLWEGDYNWWLRKFFVNRSMVTRRDFTTRKKDELTDAAGRISNHQEDGFFKVTPVPFTLYNMATDADKTDKTKLTLIRGVTKNGSPIDAELLITLQTFDPHLAIRNDDPGLEIAERARSMFRTCMGFSMSVDSAVAKDIMAHLIEGKTMVVAFTHTTIDSWPAVSIVRDTGGEPTYEIQNVTEADTQAAQSLLGIDASDAEIEAKAQTLSVERTIQDYIKHLDLHLSAKMRQAVQIRKSYTKADGKTGYRYEYLIETRSVQVGLTKILIRNGFDLTSATVGTVIIHEDILTAAVTAEIQTYENTVQVQSAKATALALKQLKSTPEDQADPAYHDKLAIAAASDPTGRSGFNRVSTDNRLATVGAAAAAMQQGKKSE